MKEAWILNLLLWKLSDLRAKDLNLNLNLKVYFASHEFWFDPKSLEPHLAKQALTIAILSLVNHLSYPRNIMHMHRSQLSISRLETQDHPRA